MTPADIRQQLHRQIDQIPSDLLIVAAEFLAFLKSRSADDTSPIASFSVAEAASGEPVLTGSTGADLLQFAGTWQGDDLEDCLEVVYETRSPAEF